MRNAVERIEKDQGTVIAAINGGFFNTSTGFGMDPVVTNGEVLSSGDGVARGILFVDENNVPSIRVASLTNTVISPGGTSFDANNMNGGRAANYLSILTPKMIGNDGASTSNRWGVELRIELLEEEPHHLRANGTTKYRVIDKGAEWTNVSPMTNDRQLILSGHGIAHHFLLDNFNVGDMVEIESTFIGAEDITIKEALPGWGHFIKDEFNATALAYSDVSQGGEGSMFHEYQRHPRSFIAYNRDKTILYMGVVEGRVDHSIGMDINEVAYFLFKFLDFDVLDALNLDGGGSSTLMAEKLEIIPSPRSFQRSIANFLYIIRE